MHNEINVIGEELLRKIQDKRSLVTVVGLGYVGLPLALALADDGFRVIGLDVDGTKVASLNDGHSYIMDIGDEEITREVKNGTFKATGDSGCLRKSDIVIVCVPTPLRKTKEPDISFIVEVVEKIKATIRAGQLIILESTSYPGTTREVVLPELESGGMQVGRDFFLAFSPERIDPANKTYNLKNTPKIVGGITPACTRLAAELYQHVAETVQPVSSSDSAEMVKLLENTFRAVNIALVNEMAIMCRRLGLDTWEIIDAAATKPFGFMPFKPGPGLGGHCIPVDPHYLSWKLRTLNYNARFVELAEEINAHMPEYVADLVTSALNDREKSVKGSKILILGVAYKKDVSDVRESPALDIINLLMKKGGEVSYHDPHVPRLKIDGGAMDSTPLDDGLMENCDCLVIVTDHSCFDWEKINDRSRLIIDTRNAMTSAGIDDPDRIVKL